MFLIIILKEWIVLIFSETRLVNKGDAYKKYKNGVWKNYITAKTTTQKELSLIKSMYDRQCKKAEFILLHFMVVNEFSIFLYKMSVVFYDYFIVK